MWYRVRYAERLKDEKEVESLCEKLMYFFFFKGHTRGNKHKHNFTQAKGLNN